MNKLTKRIACMMLCLCMLVGGAVFTFAAESQIGPKEEWTNLTGLLNTGSTEGMYSGANGKRFTVEITKEYKRSEGGYYLYSELLVNPVTSVPFGGCVVNETKFNQLNTGSKQEFLEDLVRLANSGMNLSSETDSENDDITSVAVNEMMRGIQNMDGVNATFIASLMAETKPDYATANHIYSPFSGVVNVGLAILAILTMALLGLSMALDICFITIPAVQLALDGGEGGGQGGGGKASGFGRLVSKAARGAVAAQESGGGQGGQNGGGTKSALGGYFKNRVKELVILGICLLYLVSGQIYSFVAMLINLVSGFIGF